MNDWGIILIVVLVVINTVSVLYAVWHAYVNRNNAEETGFGEILLALFVIPLGVCIAILWLISQIKECRDLFMEWKQRKASEKYHFCNSYLRLVNLPFEPTSDVIYIENEYNEQLNQIIKRNLNFIQKCFDKNEFTQPRFLYLPNLIENISHDEQSIAYYAPYLTNRTYSVNFNLTSDMLLHYMLVPENRKNITTCFARYCNWKNGYALFECVSFSIDDEADEKEFLRALCKCFNHYPKVTSSVCYYKILNDHEQDADEKFDKESRRLIKEVEERIAKLRKMGISQWALEKLVKPENKLSKIIVTKEYSILLPDYHNMEIKMEPLIKAVYLLFLRYPEGLMFKDLPSYREELTEIYLRLKPNGMTERVQKSIEDVTNPMLNSINEKCARIRGAFLLKFDEHLARSYYIDGLRAQPKKIALSRELVLWEE